MTNWQKLLSIAVSLFITIGLITLAVNSYHNTANILNYAEEQSKNTAEEWSDSDIVALTGKDITGSEVLNYARKYKSAMTVVVDNSKSVTKYTADSHVVNEMGTDEYIEPTSLFTAKIDQTVNGDISSLTFTIKGEIQEESITSLEEAKEALAANSYGKFDQTDSWSAIVGYVSKLCQQDSSPVKESLASVLTGTYSKEDSWTTLGTAAVEQLSNKKVSDGTTDENNVGVRLVTRTLAAEASYEFEPTVYMIICTDTCPCTNAGTKQIYQGGFWYVDGVSIKNEQEAHMWVCVNGNTLTNSTDHTIECLVILK